MTNHLIDSLLALTAASPMPEETRRILSESIRAAVPGMKKTPRQTSKGNDAVLSLICTLLFNEAEARYGDGAHANLSLQPSFQDNPNSQIAPLEKDPKTFGLMIGRFATSWEDVFYEIAHEMVHLLNPVAHVADKTIATLEEGVAVKLAEDVYGKYIASYTSAPPRWSPLGQGHNAYHTACAATKKIPDPVLKEIREAFGGFWAVSDAARLKLLATDYISDDECALLVTPFSYPSSP